jgi:hypothetical protein
VVGSAGSRAVAVALYSKLTQAERVQKPGCLHEAGWLEMKLVQQAHQAGCQVQRLRLIMIVSFFLRDNTLSLGGRQKLVC